MPTRRVPLRVPKLQGRSWEDVCRELQDFLSGLQDSNDEGLPAGLTTSTPNTIAHGTTASLGTASEGWIPADHDHDVSTTGTAAAIALSSSKGSAAGLAAVDHTHAAVVTTAGDLLIVGSGPALARLAIGNAGEVLSVSSGLPAWQALSALALTTWSVTSPSQITGNVDDYDLSAGQIARVDTDASRNITGVVAGSSGELKLIINVGSNDAVLKHQDTNSAEANRILANTGADLTLSANELALLIYDGTTTRWRAVEL